MTPSTNQVSAFEQIFAIEVGLRELLIDRLGNLAGEKWYLSRVSSPEMISKLKNSREYEARTPWISCIPHHPVYYLDFSDLVQLIEKADNWREAFESIFKRKDILSGQLKSLEPIRNKIAHNRMISPIDLDVLTAARSYLSNCVGDQNFRTLIARCTVAPDLPARIQEATREFAAMCDAIVECEPLPDAPNWSSMHESWWFSTEYLGIDISPVVTFEQLRKDYLSQPRNRGYGVAITRWARTVKAEECSAACYDILERLSGTR